MLSKTLKDGGSARDERSWRFNDLTELWRLVRGENNGNLSSCAALLSPASVLETWGDEEGMVTTVTTEQ